MPRLELNLLEMAALLFLEAAILFCVFKWEGKILKRQYATLFKYAGNPQFCALVLAALSREDGTLFEARGASRELGLVFKETPKEIETEKMLKAMEVLGVLYGGRVAMNERGWNALYGDMVSNTQLTAIVQAAKE
jgi:hypothetical protein